MRIKQRRLLVLLLVVCQLGCMGFGVLWATRWLHRTFDDFIYRNVAAQGRSLTYELARRVDDASIASIEPGSSGWARLQALCEQMHVPYDGFASVMRLDTGALACHSRLSDDPALLRTFPGRQPLVHEAGVSPIISAVRGAGETGDLVAAGRVELDGRLYEASLLALPQLNAVLAIQQSNESIDQNAADLIQPLFQVGMVITAAVVGATSMLTMFLVSRFESTLTTLNSSLAREVDERTHSLVRTRNAVVFGLAKLSESKDKDTAGHLERIRSYVTFLASEMAKTNAEITHHYVANLAVASALHDIGKVGVPDAVLLKVGRLTPSERRAMQMHAELGGECLAAIQRQLGDDDFLELGQQVALSHHEQWDGSGYPRGLQGKDIPLAARIVALADVYDALTSHRPYRPALSHAEAREWIVAQYGTQFDPEVVEAFVARESDFVRVSQTVQPSTTAGGDKPPAATSDTAPIGDASPASA
jgi:response regulator RpfG family c-di-GMP phosphodiesterase